MISRLRGVVRELGDYQVLLEAHGVGYEVWVAPSIRRALQERLVSEPEVELVTFHYHQLEPGRGVPILIGFLNQVEREFFLKFISVSGVGPKAALKALTQPIPVIAQAIDEGNVALLKSLPGIGDQRAREIVAKLQGKVGKFALIRQPGAGTIEAPKTSDVEEEAIAVLVQLEYRKPEAKQMVQAALARNPGVKTAEELLNEIYRQQRQAEPAPAADRRRVGEPA